jgi:hypothetical protein
MEGRGDKMKPKFENVVIIEDTHDLHGTKIKISDKNMFTEPMPLANAEEWETILTNRKIPYVLAQVETTLPDPVRFAKGYALFVDPQYLESSDE